MNGIDFEQELYKHFGQVKDFTLGMRIGKYFYELGKQSGSSEIPNNPEGLDKAAGKRLRRVCNLAEETKEDGLLEERLQELKEIRAKKDLEEAANGMAIRAFPEKKSYSTVIDRVVDYNAVDRKNYRDGIIAGAKWQKEQIMKEAVEGTVVDAGFDDSTALVSIPDKRYDEGDKVRVIVLPKED